MNMVKVYIKGQEDKNLSSFFRYYPARIKNIGFDAVFDRQIIYDFKDGHNHAEVAKCVAKMLVKNSCGIHMRGLLLLKINHIIK